jgi:hypothetical protein
MTIGELVRELESKLGYSGIDYIGLKESSSVIGRITNILFGVMSTLILILVPIITALEVIYICFPVIREMNEKVIHRLEVSGIGRKVVAISFKDAKKAIENIYCSGVSNSSTSTILFEYLKIKIKSVMFIMFALTMVLQGGQRIVDIVWNFVGSIISSIFY